MSRHIFSHLLLPSSGLELFTSFYKLAYPLSTFGAALVAYLLIKLVAVTLRCGKPTLSASLSHADITFIYHFHPPVSQCFMPNISSAAYTN